LVRDTEVLQLQDAAVEHGAHLNQLTSLLDVLP
jgi:hypothetical protein